MHCDYKSGEKAFHHVMPLYRKLLCPKVVENLGILAKCISMSISSSRVRMPTPKLYGWV